MQRLIESLHLLAADADDQLAALPPFVAVADELALIFDDELRAAEPPAAIRDALADLDAMLDRMSDDRTLWAIEAVHGDLAWTSVRDRARALLRALGEEPRRCSAQRYVRSATRAVSRALHRRVGGPGR
jgi:hypothetical protein